MESRSKRFFTTLLSIGVLFFSIYSGNVSHADEDTELETQTIETPVTPGRVLSSGASTYSIKILVPPGRAGVQPDISLSYNSFNKEGILGVGWTLNLGAIQRDTKNGLDYTKDNYVVKGNGAKELVPREYWAANYFGKKVESNFSKYFLDKDDTLGWVATKNDGTQFFYGTTPDSRQGVGSCEELSQIFKWCLEKVVDANGNHMKFVYTKEEDGQIYIKEILYTGNGDDIQPTNKVVFEYSEDLDIKENGPFKYSTHFKVATSKRLNYIKTYAYNSVNQPVRIYTINYYNKNSTSSGRYCLKSLETMASDGKILPPIRFTYTDEGDIQFKRINRVDLDNDADTSVNDNNFADFNGDGIADFMVTSVVDRDSLPDVMKYRYQLHAYWLGTRDGEFKAPYYINSNFKVDHIYYADINGDGRTNIIRINEEQSTIWVYYIGDSRDGYNTSRSIYLLNPVGEDIFM